MKILKFFLIILFIFPINSLKADNEVLKNKITKNLRCLICQGQSVYDSDSEFANSLKIVVDNKLTKDYLKIKSILIFKVNMVIGFYMTHCLIKILIFYGYYLY